MAFEGALHFLPGIVAGADLSAAGNQFKFVQLNTAGAAILAATAGQRKVVGVLQDTPPLASPALIADSGVSKVQAGAALTAGNPIMTNASGQGIVATAASSSHIQGYALETVATAGDLFACVLKYDGPNAP